MTTAAPGTRSPAPAPTQAQAQAQLPAQPESVERHTMGVGVDGSVESSVALAWALDRSRRTGSAIRLVTVIEDEAGSMGSDFALSAADEAVARIADIARTVRHESPDVVLALEVVRGPVGWALTRSVSADDLLVVGTTVGGPMNDHVLGSRSVQIASTARSAVAVIPSLLGDHRSGVVVGIETAADVLVLLELGLRESRLLGEVLHLVHCSPPADREGDRVVSAIEDAIAHVEDQVVVHRLHGDPVAGLVDAARHASLLVLGRSRTPELNPLGTTCHRVLSRAPSPVLIGSVGLAGTENDAEMDADASESGDVDR